MSSRQHPGPTPAQDFPGYLRRYLTELVTDEEADAQALFDRYHVRDFLHDHDGVVLDRDRLLAHVRAARRNVTALALDIHSALVAGDRVAARYTLRTTMRKGPPLVSDIWMFGELAADGRLRTVVSTGQTRPA